MTKSRACNPVEPWYHWSFCPSEAVFRSLFGTNARRHQINWWELEQMLGGEIRVNVSFRVLVRCISSESITVSLTGRRSWLCSSLWSNWHTLEAWGNDIQDVWFLWIEHEILSSTTSVKESMPCIVFAEFFFEMWTKVSISEWAMMIWKEYGCKTLGLGIAISLTAFAGRLIVLSSPAYPRPRFVSEWPPIVRIDYPMPKRMFRIMENRQGVQCRQARSNGQF